MENFNDNETGVKSRRRSFKLMAGVFVGIIVLAAASALGWEYFNPETRDARRQTRELQESYEAYEELAAREEARLAADTYGGETPEETLELFIEALKAGDADLAAKYFVQNEDAEMWRDVVVQTLAQGKMDEVIATLSQLKPSPRETAKEITIEYAVLNDDGIAEHTVVFLLNQYSNVWKIESL